MKTEVMIEKFEKDREYAKSKMEIVGYFPDRDVVLIEVTIPTGLFIDIQS